MRLGAWRNIPGFKIRSKKDAETFLNEVILSGDYYVQISSTKVLNISRPSRGANIHIGYKTGNIFDPFNPILVEDSEKYVDIVYKERKYINAYFF